MPMNGSTRRMAAGLMRSLSGTISAPRIAVQCAIRSFAKASFGSPNSMCSLAQLPLTDPLLILRGDLLDRDIVEAFAGGGAGQAGVGADAPVREVAPVVVGVGEAALRCHRRVH